MPELVTLAGGTPLVTKPGEYAPTLSTKQLEAFTPRSSGTSRRSTGGALSGSIPTSRKARHRSGAAMALTSSTASIGTAAHRTA